MPTINSGESVTGSGYVVYPSAKPQLLTNGWIVVAVYNSSANRLQFKVKKTPSSAWEDLTYLIRTSIMSWTLCVKETRVFLMFHASNMSATYLVNFDATNVTNLVAVTETVVDNSGQTGLFAGEDIAINDDGTELHYVMSNRGTGYVNSYNIRYLKGKVSTNGTVIWGELETVTIQNTAYRDFKNPSIILFGNSIRILCDAVLTPVGRCAVIMLNKERGETANTDSSSRITGNGWYYRTIFNDGTSSYLQEKPRGVYVPRIINGLLNGRISVAWQGTDSIENSRTNIRSSYSDDGGHSWTTAVKQTSGNSYDQTNPFFTADKTGKLFLVWNSPENVLGSNVNFTAYKVFNGTWGARTTYIGDDQYVHSVLFDAKFRLMMKKPPVLRSLATGIQYLGEYFAGASLAPLATKIGSKTEPDILSYTVLPDESSQITTIVEKLNGTLINTIENPDNLSRVFKVSKNDWDTLNFYLDNTIEIIVTDGNGVVNTKSYVFSKLLKDTSVLSASAQAMKDSNSRIRLKLDKVASSIGLAQGASIDQIIEKISSDSVSRVFKGVITSSSVSRTFQYQNGGQSNMSFVQVSSLGFKPSVIVLSKPLNSATVDSGYYMIDPNMNYRRIFRLSVYSMADSGTDNSKVFEIIDDFSNGFILPVGQPNAVYEYTAIE